MAGPGSARVLRIILFSAGFMTIIANSAISAGVGAGLGTTASSSVRVPLSRPSWTWSSIPVDENLQPISTLVSDHALMQWYNPRGVREHDLNPALTNEQGGDNERTVLEVNVQGPNGSASTFSIGTWAGITESLSPQGMDLSAAHSVEIWVNDRVQDHTQTVGRLHLDFGQTSEDALWRRDALPNGILDTEDLNLDLHLDYFKDTGLDGLTDREEPGYDAYSNPDPNGDDYHYDPNAPADYSRINGTEGDGIGLPNARPDTEDLDLNGRLDLDNSYFEMTIDLADTAYVAVDVARDYAGNPKVAPDNGWRLFRIPLESSAFTSRGTPAWDAIKHVRLWLDAMAGPTTIQIGGVDLAGDFPPENAPPIVLYQNHPNPFNPGTVIEYELLNQGPVRLTVFDVRGHLVRELVHEIESAGWHSQVWSGQAMDGRPAASGVYFYRLDAAGRSVVRRMVLAR